MTIYTGDYKKRQGAVLLFLIVIFAAVFFIGGVGIYPDTESYRQMSPIREPLYGLLLNLTVFLFGERGFFVQGLFQNALAVFAIYSVSVYIGRKYKSMLVLFASALFLCLPFIVTPLFASSKIMLSNAMISEGIALSLYYLYMLFLIKAVWEKEKTGKYLFTALALSLLLMLTRGQMLVTLVAWVLTALALIYGGKETIDFLKCKEGKKTFALLGVIGAALVTFLLRTLCISGCNLLVNGSFSGTTYGDVTILSNVIYVAERQDGDAIEDEVLQKLFYEIYDIADDGNMLYKYAPEDFSAEASFYSDMHDDIKDFAIAPVLRTYVEEEEKITEYMAKSIRVDELASALTKELIGENFGRWFLHFLRNVTAGVIRSAAFVHPLLNIPALAGFLVLILLGLYCFRKKGFSPAIQILLLTAMLTAGTTAAVAMTIMCLSRYMIYNMAFIYISALLILKEIGSTLKDRKHIKKE